MDYVFLGTILKEARIAFGETQSEIAARLGVTAQNVSSWERGKSKIDIDTYLKLCSLYKINADEPLQVAFACDSEDGLEKLPASEEKLLPNEKEVLKLFRQLNDEGQRRIAEYIEDMAQVKKYCSENVEFSKEFDIQEDMIKTLKDLSSFPPMMPTKQK